MYYETRNVDSMTRLRYELDGRRGPYFLAGGTEKQSALTRWRPQHQVLASNGTSGHRHVRT